MEREKKYKHCLKDLIRRIKAHHKALKKRNPQAGVSFMEVLVTVAIIAILMTTIAIAVIPALDDAKINTAKTHIGTFKTAINLYLLKNFDYPESLEAIKPYIDGNKIPLDPWEEKYIYTKGGPGELDYGILSKGPDRTQDTDDDVTSWKLDGNDQDGGDNFGEGANAIDAGDG